MLEDELVAVTEEVRDEEEDEVCDEEVVRVPVVDRVPDNDGDGVDGVPDKEAPPAVPDTELVGVLDDVGESNAVLESEAPPAVPDSDGVPDDVGESDGVPDNEAPPAVPNTELVFVPDSVLDGVGESNTVLESVAPPALPDGEVVRELVVVPDAVLDVVGDFDGVTVIDGVADSDDPAEGVPVPDRVGDGDDWTMPATRKPHSEAEPGLNEFAHALPLDVVVNTPTNESKLWSGGATVSPK